MIVLSFDNTVSKLAQMITPLAMLAAALVATTNIEASIQGGFQSGPSPGAFYSGGMSYIPSLNRAFLVGIHYNAGLVPHRNQNLTMRGTVRETEPSCYIAKIDFDDVVASGGDNNNNDDDDDDDVYHTLSDWKSYGGGEICGAVAAKNGPNVYVVGSVEKEARTEAVYPMQGLLSIIEQGSLQSIDETLLDSGRDPSKNIVYPLDVIHDFDPSHIYIVALTSTDARENNEVDGNRKMPNWIDQHRLGSSFDVTVTKIHAPHGQANQTQTVVWAKDFPLDVVDTGDGSRPPVSVAGLALQRDENGLEHLLVAGSTWGSFGEAFGGTKAAAGGGGVDRDFDGFVLQLSIKDGSFLKHVRHKGTVYNYDRDDLRQGTPSDDFVHGMCNNRGRVRGHRSDDFYIVGVTRGGDMTTTGVQNAQQLNNGGFQFDAGVETKLESTWNRDESTMPFLRKVNITDGKPVWTTQWAAAPGPQQNKNSVVATDAYAVDCHLDRDKGFVYVVGSVLRGAAMIQGDVELIHQGGGGGDNVWVAKIAESTGNVVWLTQLGSPDGTETPARHGSIVVNNEGNVVIFGDTNGSLYRSRNINAPEDPDNHDSFLMTIDGETGAVLDRFYRGGTSNAVFDELLGGWTVLSRDPAMVSGSTTNNDGDDRTTTPPLPQPGDTTQSTSAPTPKNTHTEKKKGQTHQEKKKSVEYDDDTKGSNNNNVNPIVVLIVSLVVGSGALVALYVVCHRKMNQRKTEDKKRSIFSCLQQFDVEDLDLRRSPPGGWHGTYTNKLADGIIENNLVAESTTDAPLTHSIVVKDSLFTDSNSNNDSGCYRDKVDFVIDNDDDYDEVDIRLNRKIV